MISKQLRLLLKIMMCSALFLIFGVIRIVDAQNRIISPTGILQIVRNGTPAEKKKLARSLELTVVSRASSGARQIGYCEELDEAESKEVRLEQPGPQYLVTITSSWCERVFLVIVERKKDQWNHIQTIPLSARYGSVPEISLVELVEPGTKEILIQKQIVDTGTGILQKNISVLKLIDRKISIILDEPEVVRFSIPSVAHGQLRNTEQRQDSEFTIILDSSGLGHRQIRESQTITDHDKEIRRSRVFIWQPDIKRFRSFPTAITPE